jgi:signal transduction histidine kinase
MTISKKLHQVTESPQMLQYYDVLRLFVQIRWFAASCVMIALAICQFFLNFPLAYPQLYAIALGICAYNALFYWLNRSANLSTESEQITDTPFWYKRRIQSLLQINLDFMALFALVHFSGGLENPLILFFLFHVVISAILLRPATALLQTAVASGLIFAIGLLEKSGLFNHYHPSFFLGSTELLDNWIFVIGFPSLLSLVMFVVAIFAITLVKQITKRQQYILSLAIELENKNEQLTRVDKLRRGLLAVASHDLKAPLDAIASYLLLFRDGYMGTLSEQQRKIIEKTLKRLEGLRNFISDILNVQSIERGNVTQNIQTTNIETLLKQAIENQELSTSKKSQTIKLHTTQQLPPIEVVPELIAQVFENVLSNAVKYTPHGGQIEVTAHIANQHLKLEFTDNGIGISEEDLPNIFEDFFRASNVKSQYEGTGLGLSLVARIVKHHRGKIWATSQIQRGTTIHITIPITQSTIEERYGRKTQVIKADTIPYTPT